MQTDSPMTRPDGNAANHVDDMTQAEIDSAYEPFADLILPRTGKLDSAKATRTGGELPAALGFMKRHGLTFGAVFVPWSQSRNRAEKNQTLNWVCELRPRRGDPLKFEYSAGVAHIPGYSFSRHQSNDTAIHVREVCELGRYRTDSYGHIAMGRLAGTTLKRWTGVLIPAASDMLHSLIMDSDVIEYRNFEDWADSMGYDPDSRSGEKTYRACLEIGLALRAILGDSGIEAAREIFQDY